LRGWGAEKKKEKKGLRLENPNDDKLRTLEKGDEKRGVEIWGNGGERHSSEGGGKGVGWKKYSQAGEGGRPGWKAWREEGLRFALSDSGLKVGQIPTWYPLSI